MQYVGKLVSTVYNTITPNINPATLSGAIDVIVVERTITTTEQIQTDLPGNPLSASEASLLPPSQRRSKTVPRTTTELASTPFHVRFGKMSVLRPAERKVTLHLNNSEHPLPFAMKVGHSGEAFFVLQIDDDEERRRIPDEMVTSPIISAAGSPIVGEQVGEEAFGDEVEPLVLGEAERPDDVPTNIDEDNPEDMDANSSQNLRRDLSVPDDSTKTGSGGAAGSDSLLDKVGSAASKASGVIGAAGRAVIGGSGNPRLDKTAEKAQREDGTEQPTGAPVDQDRQDAHQYEPEDAGSRGKKRQEAAQEDAGKKERGTPPNEMQNLEQELRNKAFAVVQGETDAEAQADEGGDEGEEAYPAPFGAGSRSLSRSKTQAVDSIRHSEYLAGKRMKPVPIADEGGKTIDPAMTDASTHIYRHNQHKLLRQTNPDDGDDQDTAIDDDDDDDDDPPHRDLHNQVEGDQDVVGAVKVKHGKQDLQYMLDMDGYKMTSDGEVLAYQEVHRFADEMPLGRRHGGKGRHGHSDRLNAPGHQHKVSLPGSSTTAMRRGSASKTHRPSFSVDYRSQRSGGRAQSRERQGGRRESMDDTVAANLVKFNSQHGSPRLGLMQGQGQSGGHQDELELSRDLARLARMNRASSGVGDGTGADLRLRGRKQPKAPQESLRRHASLNNRKQQQGAGRSGSRQRRNNPHSRHTHEFSLSDTEAEVPRARSNSTENSADDGSYSVSDVVSSLRELRMPSEEVPPAYLGDTSTAHLGLSNNGRWQWADPRASDSTSSTHTGQPSDRRRTRFASTDGYDPLSRPSVSSSNATALEALRRHTAGGQVAGKLTSSDSEPYTFLLQLEDSSHSFELSLCYSEGFGRDEEADERTLSGRGEDGEEEAEEEVNVGGSGSYWSRWWKGSSKSIPDLKAAADSQAETASLNDKPSMANTAVEARSERSSTDSMLLDSQTDPNTTSSKRLGITTPTPTATATASASAAAQRTGKTYAKTLRLTSDQLKSLNLRKGANSITFSVTSSYSGVATCSARIFLWESSHKIVVSDIDGTITKSDALGHVFTMIGRDWTHIGVAKLYTDIARNGYRIMYLTSRAIGQADSTRDYLKGIRQNGYQLPDGPVIMSPDRLIASLHREVILRKPEVFKMACLRDIARLFRADARSALSQPGGDITNKVRREAMEKVEKGAGAQDGPAAGATTASAAGSASEEVLAPLSPSSNLSSPTLASLQVQEARREKKEDHPTPFYAGFGNRITDALSYRSVNIPSSRIFTIDTNGEVKMELLELAGYKSSYIHMTDLVDQMFPPITAKEEKEPRKPEFNDFNYWRPAIDMDIELPPDEELLGTPPVSPALSARSARSLRSVRSLTYDTPAGMGGAETGEEKGGGGGGGRLSRFGLGSLGLSRKGIQSSTTLTSAKTESEEEHGRRLQRATSAEPALETTDTTLTDMSTSTSTSWTAPWRRRAASPPGSTTTADGRANSPLIGPAITAEPESEDEQFYDSEAIDDDDDVSSFGAGVATGGSRSNSFANPDHHFLYRAQANKNSLQQRLSEDESFAEGEDVEEEEMEDPLLETGEIRFEWKG
ncbi:related to SMP2 protein, involved in plasmid maintenance, respiration and cell proliferation [Ustilago bromivora]|uniref:Related to SMP2 protein, involved in plasmid maintenance, respiration and cell proliferation n=1 Tax=Ustilago bromivora TaxID=307758 RepID=A0A8H8TN33_9BASI|nr:related to SMP2 protein, involved in plasmid maintenance, respiration and cell proliferation [Ustilago bromivora]